MICSQHSTDVRYCCLQSNCVLDKLERKRKEKRTRTKQVWLTSEELVAVEWRGQRNRKMNNFYDVIAHYHCWGIVASNSIPSKIPSMICFECYMMFYRLDISTGRNENSHNDEINRTYSLNVHCSLAEDSETCDVCWKCIEHHGMNLFLMRAYSMLRCFHNRIMWMIDFKKSIRWWLCHQNLYSIPDELHSANFVFTISFILRMKA